MTVERKIYRVKEEFNENKRLVPVGEIVETNYEDLLYTLEAFNFINISVHCGSTQFYYFRTLERAEKFINNCNEIIVKSKEQAIEHLFYEDVDDGEIAEIQDEDI